METVREGREREREMGEGERNKRLDRYLLTNLITN